MPEDAPGGGFADPFSYRVTRAGAVHVSRAGRVVGIIGPRQARGLAARLAEANGRETQLLLAKATGNYRR